MQLIPLIYLKNGKATQPVGTRPEWFSEEAVSLVQALVSQGAQALYINDLNIPTAGKSPNFSSIAAIRKNFTDLNIIVTGNFRTLQSIDDYAELGVQKVVLTGAAYQVPDFAADAVKKFYKLISVRIEVKNGRVVIPGLIGPTRKSALDYGKQFEENGVTSLCLADTNLDGVMDASHFQSIQAFCTQMSVPVLSLGDIQKMQDLEPLFAAESSGLYGTVVGKSLYSNAIDLHSCKAYLDDLAASVNIEETVS